MNANYSVFTTNDSHTLLYNGYWTTIPTTDDVMIARGIASIMAELWYEEGQDAVRMMRLNASRLLEDMGFLPTLNQSIIDDMVDIAKTVQEKGTQND